MLKGPPSGGPSFLAPIHIITFAVHPNRWIVGIINDVMHSHAVQRTAQI